jgi:phosphoribosyl 1,2-cyclic phosphodiesterase
LLYFAAMLFVASLNSGSNGNCYYIGNREEAVLVDMGISCREMEKRMLGLGLDPYMLKAIFISHEHTDHISGLSSLVKKFRLPVYITAATYRGCSFLLDEQLLNGFEAFSPVQIGSLLVTAFPKLHDAVDPHSFIISSEGVTAGVFTDIGEPCKNVIHYFKQCHAVFLESNYDEAMLANSRYPFFLQNRISGKRGHLSNSQALELMTLHRPACMSHIFLSHLSKENNTPALATALFNQHANGATIVHAPRDGATAVYHVLPGRTPTTLPSAGRPPAVLPGKKRFSAENQLSLF